MTQAHMFMCCVVLFGVMCCVAVCVRCVCGLLSVCLASLVCVWPGLCVLCLACLVCVDTFSVCVAALVRWCALVCVSQLVGSCVRPSVCPSLPPWPSPLAFPLGVCISVPPVPWCGV